MGADQMILQLHDRVPYRNMLGLVLPLKTPVLHADCTNSAEQWATTTTTNETCLVGLRLL